MLHRSISAHRSTTLSRLSLSYPLPAAAFLFDKHRSTQPNTSYTRTATRRNMGVSSSPLAGDTFFLDGFAVRQWDDPNYSGTKISYDKAEFVSKIHTFFKEGGSQLVDGYAPFCKHVFVPNFVGAELGALEITETNRHLVRSGYKKRRPEELAVLSRWFDRGDVSPLPTSKMLDIILYSREQIIKEYEAMPAADKTSSGLDAIPDVPWGIISIKAQDEDFETPMQPITIMRNSLGREEGGSGVSIDRDAYQQSCDYWETHAIVA